MPFVSWRSVAGRPRGRAEVLFPDGTSLAVDEFTTLELQDRALIRMPAGARPVDRRRRQQSGNAVRYQVDTPPAAAMTDGPGEYRVATMNGRGEIETELAVFRGYATLATDIGSTAVRAGERSLARDGSRRVSRCCSIPRGSTPSIRWASARRDARLGTRQPLPAARSLRIQQHVRSARLVELPGSIRKRLVSHGGVRLAAVLLRLLVSPSGVRLDMGRLRRLGMAHTSLRPMGIWGGPLVLGTWSDVGRRLGVVGGGAGIRRMVSRRVLRRRRVFVRGLRRRAVGLGRRLDAVFRTREPIPRPLPRVAAHGHSSANAIRRSGKGPALSGRARTGRHAPSRGPPVARSSARARSPPRVASLRPFQALPLRLHRTSPSSVAPSETTFTEAMPRDRWISGDANVNRYVPDTRTLGGRPATAVPRQAVPAAPVPNESPASTSPRWYPPARPRPRLEQTPGGDPPQRAHRLLRRRVRALTPPTVAGAARPSGAQRHRQRSRRPK